MMEKEEPSDTQLPCSSIVGAVAPEITPEKADHNHDANVPGMPMENNPLPAYTRLDFSFLTMGMMAVVLMIALDNYIIATALPRLIDDLHGLQLVGWYGSSYFLTLMAFQPVWGQLFTLFASKPLYLLSILGFEVGSAISASAPTPVAFIIGRAVCGIFGGGIYCGTLTLVAQSVPVRTRHLYMSVVTSMYGVASALGPLLGGIFTDSTVLKWRFCFWINLPIGFIAWALIARFLKPPPLGPLALTLSVRKKLRRIDMTGTILLTAAFSSLFLALQWGGTTFAWSDSRVWGCLLGFGLILSAFVILQNRLGERATIPSRILQQRTAASGYLFCLLVSMAQCVHITYLPLYLQSVHGYSALASGVHLLPYLMPLLISSLISGYLISAIGYYNPFMFLGMILMITGSSLIVTLSITSSQGQLIGYQFITGLGIGICRQIPYSTVSLKLHTDDLALASAFVAFCNSGGSMLGTVIAQSIFTNLLVQQAAPIKDIDVTALLNGGAAQLSSLVPVALLDVVRTAYNYALTRSFIFAIPCGSLALISSFFMEWINVKKH